MSSTFMTIGLRIGRENTSNQVQRSRQQIYESISRMADAEQYIIEQRNGQRFFGPPIGKSLPSMPLPKECEVFLGSIPRNVYEDQLVPILKMAGSLLLFRLMMDFAGTNRGFGFALFERREDAAEACRILHNYEILPGRYMVCLPCYDNNSLYLGGIRNKHPEEIIYLIFQKTPNAIQVTVTVPDDRARRYTVIRFGSHRDAALARRYYLVANYELWRSKYQVIVDWMNRHQIHLPFYLVGTKDEFGAVRFNYFNNNSHQLQYK